MQLYRDTGNLPARLWIVRHGESAGNVAWNEAVKSSSHRIDISARDVDVPLSEPGERQADALGHWFAKQEERPEFILSSPSLRATETASRIQKASGLGDGAAKISVDERLREKEFGVLDGLTRAGIEAAFPEQAAFRTLHGKFYHRPPGGESWCDVILRLRSLMDTLSLHFAGRRVLICSHQVVVLCLRYLLEDMNEEEILAIDRLGDVANCGVTEYLYRGEEALKEEGLQLVRYNLVHPLEAEGAAVTTESDKKAAAP